MKSIYLALMGLCVLIISCNKNDNNNENPPANTRDWFGLKTVVYTSYANGSIYNNSDSTEITIDSANNKVVFRSYGIQNIYKDTSVETFTYDGQNKLVLYEKVSNYDRLYISRMQFIRDASGKVVKILSGYKNGLMATSEGSVKYDKRGDTTFVTYLDSTLKHPEKYTDAQDFYQVGIVNDRVVYEKTYSNWSPAGRLDSSQIKYDYDAAGNITTSTYQWNDWTPRITTYQHGTETPKELQKFMEQWATDLLWFTRSKLFGFRLTLATVDTYKGNVLLSEKAGNTTIYSYTNTFDAKGNLASVNWKQTIGMVSPTTYNITEKYYYHP